MSLRDTRQSAALIVISLLAILWVAIIAQYVPARYSYDWDSSQLGRGVAEYSIQKHQPHPPGYPLWVAAARIAAKLAPSIPGALSVLALLFSVGGLIFFWLTARELLAGGDPVWLAALLAFAPPVLFYSAAQSSYSSDFFAACAAGYFAVKIWKGAPRHFLYFCLFMALAMGLRQSGAVFLVPLLALSGFTAWRRSKSEFGLGLAMGAAGFAAWFVPFVRLAGGWAKYGEMTSGQFSATVSRTSILFGAPAADHLAMLVDLAAWSTTALAGLAFAGAMPRAIAGESEAGNVLAPPRLLVFLWAAPNLLFGALFHFPKPGYLMLSLPALFLGIGLAARIHGRSWKTRAAAIMGIAISLAVSYFPYQEWGPVRYAGLCFQVARYMPPALSRIDADNRLLANAFAQAGPRTPVICVHWSGESPNCRSAPWDFAGGRWVDRRSYADSLSAGSEVLFLCGRSGPPAVWRAKMREWTQLAEGWQISVWRARK